MFKQYKVIALASVYLISGCANMDGNGSTSRTASGDDNSGCTFAAIVAAAACGLGSDKNKAVKAALCAAAAYATCSIAKSYMSEKVKTAKEVEQDYTRQHGKLPEQPTITAYATDINPHSAISKGESVNVMSNIVVVSGVRSRVAKVEEEITLIDTVGEQWGKPVRKPANSGNEAGQFRTNFTIPVHNDMSQGVYKIRKTLYINGARAKTDDSTKFQVVLNQGGTRYAYLK